MLKNIKKATVVDFIFKILLIISMLYIKLDIYLINNNFITYYLIMYN